MSDYPFAFTKRIPERTHTEKAQWCHRDFTQMSQQFRAVRTKARNKMDKCFWCHHAFEDGEMMALAAFECGNQTLCQACAEKLLATEKGIED